MQSHIHNNHPDRSSDHKKMVHAAEKTMQDVVAA